MDLGAEAVGAEALGDEAGARAGHCHSPGDLELVATRDGKLATSYYDRQYGRDELTGWSDFSLSGSRGLEHFGVVRVTSSSMPPPTQFAGGFFGDYTGLAADRVAYPAWSDTRTPAPVLCPGTGTPGHPPRLCVTPAPNTPPTTTTRRSTSPR